MSHYRDRWKNFLQIIIQKSASCLENYSFKEKVILEDFFQVLAKYNVDIVLNREKFINAAGEFREKYYNTDDYYSVSFLWFAIQYFDNSLVILAEEELYANRFYQYLVQYLRIDPQATFTGVLQLLQRKTPLNSADWELLQYACVDLLVKLNPEDIQLLNLTNQMINEKDIASLDQKEIIRNLSQSAVAKTRKDIIRLFNILQGRWSILFHFPAFGIQRVVCDLELAPPVTIGDVFPHNTSLKSILSASEVYQFQKLETAYLIIVYLPNRSIQLLQVYLEKLNTQGKIKHFEITSVIETRISSSLKHYHPEKKWLMPIKKDIDTLIKKLQTPHPRRGKVTEDLFLTTPMNKSWNIFGRPETLELLNTFCKNLWFRDFNQLGDLQSKSTQQKYKQFTTLHSHLNTLISNEVAQIFFIPYTLVNLFSLDEYIIKLPLLPEFQLRRFLELPPVSQLFITETSIIIWTRLPEWLVKLCQRLNWTITPVQRPYAAPVIQSEWYDFNSHTWNLPDWFTGSSM
jgi:hypothetical protein